MIPDAFEKVIGWEFRIRCGKSVLRIITFLFFATSMSEL